MVIQQPVQNPLAEILNSAEHPRRTSRQMLYIATGVLLLHLAGAAYLYSQKVATPEMAKDDDHGVTIITYRIPKPVTPKPVTHPKPVANTAVVHKAAETPVTPPKPMDITHTEDHPAGQGPTIIDTRPPPQPPQPPAQPANPAGPPVITDPTWTSKPSADQLSQFYPVRALNLGKSGDVTLQCRVLQKGTVTGCSVLAETPDSFGFGAAAVKLSRFFRMSPRMEDGRPVDGATVKIRLAFRPAQ